MQFRRSSGILLHPTSLPNEYGIGTLGKEAYNFVDFLYNAKQKLWQILPLGPTGFGDSPYQCFSAFAGNPLLISFEKLIELELLEIADMQSMPKFNKSKVEFGKVINYKYPLLRKAFKRFKQNSSTDMENEYFHFCTKNLSWLSDYSLYTALKEHFDMKSWHNWPQEIILCEDHAINILMPQLVENIEFQKFMQFIFFKQWNDLKYYANNKGIKIIGDIPLYVAYDSADAWANPALFQFDEEHKPLKVAGVPPDYFSKTGQLWGNPIYDWNFHKQTNFAWWIERVKHNFNLFDIVRVDHFRGLAAYWAVPYGDATAEKGEWVLCPGKELFQTLKDTLGELPIIAEDLGLITPDVIELREEFNLPGMKILQFAFDTSEENNYLPHTYTHNSVVYTGTHDNNTTLGWFQNAKKEEKKLVYDYTNAKDNDICFAFIQLAFASVANIAIIPMQDVLKEDEDARMNFPGSSTGNWQWRFKKSNLSSTLEKKLSKLATIYFR